jgi:hypothetical protein
MAGGKNLRSFILLIIFIISANLQVNANELKKLNGCDEASDTGLSTIFRKCSGVKVFAQRGLVSDLSIEAALSQLAIIKSRSRKEEVIFADDLLISFQSIHGLSGIDAFFSANDSIVLLFEGGVQVYFPEKGKWRVVELAK